MEVLFTYSPSQLGAALPNPAGGPSFLSGAFTPKFLGTHKSHSS